MVFLFKNFLLRFLAFIAFVMLTYSFLILFIIMSYITFTSKCYYQHWYNILSWVIVWPWKGPVCVRPSDDLFRSSVLGDRFGTLADSVFGQFSGEEKADCCLYFTAADGRFLVVLRQTRCFGGDALEDVIDEAVHDWHRTTWDASVGMDLFQNLVDVNAVALFPLPAPPLSTWSRSLNDLLGTFLGDLSGWSHCNCVCDA